jgi:hypothetical protein
VCDQPIGNEDLQIIALQNSRSNVSRYFVKPKQKQFVFCYVCVNFREMKTTHKALFMGEVIASVIGKTFCMNKTQLVRFTRKQHRSQTKKFVMLRVNVGVADSVRVFPFKSHMSFLTQFNREQNDGDAIVGLVRIHAALMGLMISVVEPNCVWCNLSAPPGFRWFKQPIQ